MSVSKFHPKGYSILLFRISVKATARTYDVRLDERGVVYVDSDEIFITAVDNQHGG